MKITGYNDYVPLYPTDEAGVGTPVDEGEDRLVFFKQPEILYSYTINDEVKIVFVPQENILGYLE